MYADDEMAPPSPGSVVTDPDDTVQDAVDAEDRAAPPSTGSGVAEAPPAIPFCGRPSDQSIDEKFKKFQAENRARSTAPLDVRLTLPGSGSMEARRGDGAGNVRDMADDVQPVIPPKARPQPAPARASKPPAAVPRRVPYQNTDEWRTVHRAEASDAEVKMALGYHASDRVDLRRERVIYLKALSRKGWKGDPDYHWTDVEYDRSAREKYSRDWSSKWCFPPPAWTFNEGGHRWRLQWEAGGTTQPRNVKPVPSHSRV